MGDLSRLLRVPVTPDWQALRANLRREGSPARVHYMELYEDAEIKEAVLQRFHLADGVDPADPHADLRREIAVQRFLGYDTVVCAVDWPGFPRPKLPAPDTTAAAALSRGTRQWNDEHRGPVGSWAAFDAYPWPRADQIRTDRLEWLARELPEDMCIYSGCHSVFENVTWLMGYESFCLALYDQPDLVTAIFERVGRCLLDVCRVLVQLPRVELLFGGDDMGFNTQTMAPPQVLIEQALPWHRRMAALAHERGRLYLLHSCGNLRAIMPALIDDVRIDARHSFEDAIEPVIEAKRTWGDRIALVGGLDMDLFCRGTEAQIWRRVREILDVCLPGGGYCLGAGNTVANYVPLEHYLIMLDEGRTYAA